MLYLYCFLYLKIKENVIKQALLSLYSINEFSEDSFVNLCADEVSFQDLALIIRKYSTYHTVSFSKTQKNLSKTEKEGQRVNFLYSSTGLSFGIF